MTSLEFPRLQEMVIKQRLIEVPTTELEEQTQMIGTEITGERAIELRHLRQIRNHLEDISDKSKFPEGTYSFRVEIHDNTGNKNFVVSDSFIIDRPSTPNPITNIILLLMSPLLAFGGGVGLAALYERVKGLRGA